jgi:hypothetical protein
MSVPILSSEWLIWAMFAGGAVVVVLLTVAIALLSRDSHRTPQHHAQVSPPSPDAEAATKEHALV